MGQVTYQSELVESRQFLMLYIFYFIAALIALVIVANIVIGFVSAFRFRIELGRQRDLIMPRIVNDDFLKTGQKTNPEGIPNRPLFETSLRIVYVVDFKNNMAFVNHQHRTSSNLSEDELYDLAMSNLKNRFPENFVQAALREKSLVVIKTFDGYDAARLLLVPGHLLDGQSVAVTIPDRDTLSISPIPHDDDWDGLRQAAQCPCGTLLFDKPLIVTRNLIAVKE